jgi:hypothetical protein
MDMPEIYHICRLLVYPLLNRCSSKTQSFLPQGALVTPLKTISLILDLPVAHFSLPPLQNVTKMPRYSVSISA